MNAEPPMVPSPWTPISSPRPRRPVSSESNSNSAGSSSLDTASASANLERYDVSQSFFDVVGAFRGQAILRRSRSYNAFVGWNATTSGGRPLKHLRPLGGASRKRLIRQIQQLTKDKADLQAQLAALAVDGSMEEPVSDPITPAKAAEKDSTPVKDAVYGIDGIDGRAIGIDGRHDSFDGSGDGNQEGQDDINARQNSMNRRQDGSDGRQDGIDSRQDHIDEGQDDMDGMITSGGKDNGRHDRLESRKSVPTSSRVPLTGETPSNPYPFIDGLVGYPSTLAGPEQSLESTGPSSMEHIAALASRLRMALETSTTGLLDEEDAAMLERPGMTSLLLKRSPNPERAQLYARFFAKRYIEMQKKPEDRCAALQPGPLQRTIKHPAYVNILMSDLRESFIAHMGAFDETEFGLWILNGVEFHSEALSDTQVEIGELDDDYYEFSEDFYKRFPFTGTKEMILNSNRWRAIRGEPLLEQSIEMAKAENYTRSKQKLAESS